MSKNSDYNTGQITFKAIREWREDERPREKLMKHGASALSDAEILAIIIQSGTRSFSALDAAKALLERHGTITKLASCDYSEFKHVKGLGTAKSILLAAAIELSRRIMSDPFENELIIRSPEDVAQRYIPKLRGSRTEVFRTLLLNSSNQVFREVIVSEGILNSSLVHPREVFRLAITESAAAIILLHNHPSGNPEPSKEDLAITKKLVEAGKLIEIKVIDHIIIAGENFTSLSARGLM